MSGGTRGAKRPLARPLDGEVRRHGEQTPLSANQYLIALAELWCQLISVRSVAVPIAGANSAVVSSKRGV